MKQVALGMAVVVAWVLLSTLPLTLPPRIGEGDFRGYWSASYLLARGENFVDPAQMDRTERDQTGWSESYTLFNWYPPWLLVLLAPYTLVPYQRAVGWWLLTNIALIFVSVAVLWYLCAERHTTRRRVSLPLLVAFAYSPTLVALISGQVNMIVLAGLAGFVFFSARRQQASAGASLALTMIKPQLVYLTVPILLLECIRRREWRTLTGFAGVLLVLSAIAFLLRPSLPWEYGSTVGGAMVLEWETPTLGGVLDAAFKWQWAKLMGLVILPLAIFAWWRAGTSWNAHLLVDVTVLLSVLTAPYGWSFDFVVLLVPLLHVIAWAIDARKARVQAIALALLLVTADAFSFYERILSPSEVYFFWIPWVIAAVYAFFAWQSVGRRASLVERGLPAT